MKQQKKEPQIGDKRVHKCEHTFKEVVQEWISTRNEAPWWACDHKDTDEEDAEEVRKFKQQQIDNGNNQ